MRHLVTLFLLAVSTPVLAQTPTQCQANGTCPRTAYRQPARAVHTPPRYVTPAVYARPAVYYRQTPAPVYASPVAYTQTTAMTYEDSPAGFLAALNAWRGLRGRPPVGWDAALAAYASRNNGVHASGSSGGASQCWAGARGYTAAFRMWIASPAHAAILLNATTSVGVSPCPTGMTANAR